MERLTPNQARVATAIAQSKTRREIAREMGLCVQSVDKYISRIGARLAFDPAKQPEAMMTLWAVRASLIEAVHAAYGAPVLAVLTQPAHAARAPRAAHR